MHALRMFKSFWKRIACVTGRGFRTTIHNNLTIADANKTYWNNYW